MSDLWMQYYFAPYIERADKVAEKSKHKTTIVRDLFAEYEKVFGVPLKRFNIEEKVEPKEQ
jgi:hypothetical protein